jgi:hypothetical protein
MNILTKDAILNADDLQTETVSVPEWGGEVIVKTLTGMERDEFENSILGDTEKPDITNVRAKAVALSVVDQSGDRLFSPEDVLKLGKKNGRALDRIFAVVQRLNGLRKKDMEELIKNSEGAPGANCTSA